MSDVALGRHALGRPGLVAFVPTGRLIRRHRRPSITRTALALLVCMIREWMTL